MVSPWTNNGECLWGTRGLRVLSTMTRCVSSQRAETGDRRTRVKGQRRVRNGAGARSTSFENSWEARASQCILW